ncbi:MAG: site-specific integrase [Bifidobacteriaceae bacterium]|jgi:site-specific recombinase XerD|nr:site-specific integrase [Bifidobacteriaceae bacterium]
MARPPAEAAAVARHINGFLSSLAPSRTNRSGRTAKSYRDALTLYVGFLETVNKTRPAQLRADCFARENIKEWLAWLADARGCGPATRNNRLAAITAFLKYLAGKDIACLCLHEDARAIPRAKVARRKVEGLSRQAVKALMRAPDQSTRTGRRDLAIMVFLYATACRIDELLSLRVAHLALDTDRPSVTVVGKGNKVRTLSLLPKAAAHLRRHLAEHHGPDPDPEAYVFYSRNTGPSGKMTQPAVAKQLKKHAAAARRECPQVPAGMHAHRFRHAKASHWLEDGMNIVQISFLLGHESIQTTMVYLDITTEQEAAALATLEGERDKAAPKRWKTAAGGLAAFCGLDPLKP